MFRCHLPLLFCLSFVFPVFPGCFPAGTGFPVSSELGPVPVCCVLMAADYNVCVTSPLLSEQRGALQDSRATRLACFSSLLSEWRAVFGVRTHDFETCGTVWNVLSCTIQHNRVSHNARFLKNSGNMNSGADPSETM
jgi:hypothetical protein